MNPLESLAISVILSVMQSVVKDAKLKAAVETQMIGVGTLILEEYGYTVTPPASTTVPTVAAAAPAEAH
jgi:hypothetical protein